MFTNCQDFNPLSPCGERRHRRDCRRWLHRFQSTLPMRGETDRLSVVLVETAYFNPLSPCGERQQAEMRSSTRCSFQSTLPMRGETSGASVIVGTNAVFQSTLPMRGETGVRQCPHPTPLISIHSPHAGRDRGCTLPLLYCFYFNPLSPCGERRTVPRQKIPAD